MLPFLVAQIINIVSYFFIRIEGHPNLAAIALALGSVANIVLDYVFIVQFQWGLRGVEIATGLAQLISMFVLFSYFFDKNRQLDFPFKQDCWFEVFSALSNGLSAFVSEITAGMIAFILNWILITSAALHFLWVFRLAEWVIFLVVLYLFTAHKPSLVVVGSV